MLDDYFEHPHNPHTFRALSGMGDPALESARPTYAPDWSAPQDRARLKLLMPSQDISQSYFYPDFGECRLDGPMMVLKARIAALGENHPYVQQWIRVEQAVLSRCGASRTAAAAELPPEMATQDGAIARLQTQDRAYQQAALLFYRDTNAALEAFQKVAQDKNSPDRALAAYMVLAIHAGSKGYYRLASAALAPKDAVAEIHAAMADPSLAEIHVMASGLIGYIGATVADGPARQAQIGEALAALEMPAEKLAADPQAGARYLDALADIPYLFGDDGDRKLSGWVLTGEVPADYTASAALADFAKTDPLAAWIGFPANPYARRPWAVAAQQSLPAPARRYLDTHARPEARNVWVHVDPATPVSIRARLTDEETQRLQACPGDAQAAAALALDFPELVRRQYMDGGKAGEADALRRLQAFPFRTSQAYRETADAALVYLVTRNRLPAARRLRDALKMDGPQSANTGIYWSVTALMVLAEDENHLVKLASSHPYYDRTMLNPLSIAELWRLAGRVEFKRGERAMFARSAWSREYALGRTIGKEHDKLMRELNPEITGKWQSTTGRDVTPDDRRILADVLASPGMNAVMDSFSRMPGGTGDDTHGALTGIDYYNHNDNNWWCGWESKLRGKQRTDLLRGTFSVYTYDDKMPDYFNSISRDLQPALRASFLERMSDRVELAALARTDCAPRMLGLRTIAWVKHPGWFDSRDAQAEALANVVLATRYGCNRQGSHTVYSREAFALLHTKFGDTAAAKRTRYWFH
jgi:hypothetical protein